MAQVAITLAGLDARLRNGTVYLRNPALWTGFVLMLLWATNNSLRVYFSGLPDLSVNIPLESYISDPAWGKTFQTNFTFSGLFFAIGLLMEINVLLSFVLGFVLFRLQYWFGEASGLSSDVRYPYGADQLTGGIFSYALLTLWMARRFLWKTGREAFSNEKTTEVLHSRTAYLIMAAALAGIALLGVWAGMNISGMLVFAVALLLALMVAMKLRAEMGYTGSNLFTPGDQILLCLFGLLGSFSLFKPHTAMFCALFATAFSGRSCPSCRDCRWS